MSFIPEKARASNKRLFMDSAEGFATILAIGATVFLVPAIWKFIAADCYALLRSLYGSGGLAELLFWMIKLGAYPLAFYAIRMSLVTTFMSFAFAAAMRLI